MEDNKKRLDKFIKDGMAVENTSFDFSNKIMQNINATEKAKDRALGSLLQKHTLEQPSMGFSSAVLDEIHALSTAKAYQPVISKKVWYIIFSLVFLIICYILFYMDDLQTSTFIVDAYLIKLERLFTFELPDILSSPIFALSMFALSTLLFLDYFLKNRKTIV